MKRTLQLIMIFILIATSSVFIPLLRISRAQSETEPNPESLPNRLFMPFVELSGRYSITGKVTGPDGGPVEGVTIIDQQGHKTTSNTDGSYSLKGLDTGSYILAPDKEGLLFNPNITEVKITSTSVTQNFIAVTAYDDAIRNGSFESEDAWDLTTTGITTTYSTDAAHSGLRSVLTGILNNSHNISSYSSANQKVTIPANVAIANLRVWLYPLSGETLASAHNLAGVQPLPERPSNLESAVEAMAGDVQYVHLVDPQDHSLIETLLWMRSDAQQWQVYNFNVTKYAGREVIVQVGTYNDGTGEVSAMFTDDVALESVQQPPTPTCANYFVNPGFEAYDGWEIPITSYMAGYSMALAHSGVQSMRTGIVNTNVNVNNYSYSDAYQEVTIPNDATYANFGVYLYMRSEEVSTTGLTEASQENILDVPQGTLWGETALAGDVQYVLVVDKNGYLLDILRSWHKNTEAWNYWEWDLLEYRGKTIRLQFGTYNDGLNGRTAMYADDFLLDICSAAPTPTPSPPTPTPPPPGVGTELFGNTSFESDEDWGIPITRYTAGYSTDQAHTGTRSMRNGITLSGHNRYSYSDAYQTAHLPSGADSVTLSMYIYQLTTESTPLASAEQPTAALSPLATSAGDVQYVLLLDWYGNWIDTLLWKRKNTEAWNNHTFDLTDYRGRYIRVQFGVYNNGYGGYTSMYVDDVSLVAVQ